MKPASPLALAFSLLVLGCVVSPRLNSLLANEPQPPTRPNVIVIMVDDMGFSDLGCYGGDVQTPNLDRLAAKGLRYTQFYNCAKCETTRATLMTGRYYPEVSNSKLQDRQTQADCWTIAQAMQWAGYRTLMTGKWHLNQTPLDYGFQRYFGHLSGATNFFTGDNTFRLDDEPFEVPREGFYTTDAFTDYAIEFITESRQQHSDQPFFLYVAYNAPHYPLQAPREEVEKYRGRYRIGWDQLRKQRFARQQEMGMFSAAVELAPRPADVPAWDSLTAAEQDHQDLMMATFAGMIDRVDQNIGRLVQTLETLGVRDNTLILFLDDNGACPFQRSQQPTIDQNLMPWNPKSFWCYDKRWAHACNTPFREYKQNQHEGGITSPLIVNWPAKIGPQSNLAGTFVRQPSHLVDIMATCVDLAQKPQPDTVNGQPLPALRGLSLQPHFEGRRRADHEAIFFSFYGKNNALRVGDWKLVNIDFGDFELYNLAEDRTELHDLATENPEKLAEMIKLWDRYATEIGETRKKRPGKGRGTGKKKAEDNPPQLR